MFADGENYISDSQIFTFTYNVNRICFNLTILDNDLYELNKQFSVILTTSDPQVDIMPAVTVVTIQDVDCESTQWKNAVLKHADRGGAKVLTV